MKLCSKRPRQTWAGKSNHGMGMWRVLATAVTGVCPRWCRMETLEPRVLLSGSPVMEGLWIDGVSMDAPGSVYNAPKNTDVWVECMWRNAGGTGAGGIMVSFPKTSFASDLALDSMGGMVYMTDENPDGRPDIKQSGDQIVGINGPMTATHLMLQGQDAQWTTDEYHYLAFSIHTSSVSMLLPLTVRGQIDDTQVPGTGSANGDQQGWPTYGYTIVVGNLAELNSVVSVAGTVNGEGYQVNAGHADVLNLGGTLTGRGAGTVNYHWEYMPMSGGAWTALPDQTMTLAEGQVAIPNTQTAVPGIGDWVYRMVTTAPNVIMSNPIRVTVTNSLPTVTSFNKTKINQDTTAHFTADEFANAFSDPDVGDTLQRIRITSLPTNGVLRLAGVPVYVGQELTVGPGGPLFSGITSLSQGELPSGSIYDLTYTPFGGYIGTDSFGWMGADAWDYALMPAQVNLTITETILPTARFNSIPEITGGSSATFTVTFQDNVGIDVSTLRMGNIKVTGPNNYNALAQFVSVDDNTNGTPRVATYRVFPSGSAWTNLNNGVYTVALQTDRVADTSGNFVLSGTLGTFSVNVVMAAEIAVTGNGVNIVCGNAVVKTTDNTDFGTVVQGSTSPVRTFVIRNDGNIPLTLGQITLPGGFSLRVPAAGSVAPKSSYSLQVQLNTQVAGAFSGNISIVNNDGGGVDGVENPFTFKIAGTVQAASAEITVLGNNVAINNNSNTISLIDGTDFSASRQGATSPSRSFTIRNDGNTNLTLGAISVPSGFKIITTPPSTIYPKASYTLTVQLLTQTVGSFDGNIVIPNNDGDGGDGVESPFTFRVSGQVLAPAAGAEISVQGNGQNIPNGNTVVRGGDGTDFGLVTQGATGTIVRTYTIRNDGPATLTLGTINVPAGFKLWTTPPKTIAPNSTFNLQIQLNPISAGTFSGNVEIYNGDEDNGDGVENPFTFMISATVTAPVVGSEITVLGNGINIVSGSATAKTTDGTDFGSVEQGKPVVTRSFIIRNDGSVAMLLGTITVPAGFKLTVTPPTSIGPKSSYVFSVQMLTQTIGAYSGVVSIPNSESDGGDGVENPFTFAIRGEILPPSPEIAVQGMGLNIANGTTIVQSANGTDFGQVVQGSPTTLTRTFTIRNDGGSVMTLGPITVPVGFKLLTTPPTTIAVHSSTSISVQMLPMTQGTYSGNVVIPNNDGDGGDGVENPFTFAISGVVNPVASGAEISVQGCGWDIPNGNHVVSTVDYTNFGTVIVSGTMNVTHSFVIHNDGNTSLNIGTITVPNGFLITGTPPTVISPKGSYTLTVQLLTQSAGSFDGMVVIPNNDDDGGDGVENPFTFRIAGAVQMATPEITVLGNGVSIANGDTTPSKSDSTDFGIIAPNSGTVSRSFTIRNDGNTVLTFGTITIPAGFKLMSAQPTSLGPKTSATINVQLISTATLGTFDGMIVIPNNDADGGDGVESNFTFRISALVQAAPEITVQGNTINIANGSMTVNFADGTDFGSAAQNVSNPSRTFTIKNDGNSTLTIGTITMPQGFLLSMSPASSISPNSSTTFTVQLRTQTVGAFSGNILISSNDADGGDGVENPFSFAVSGVVTPLAPTAEITLQGNSRDIPYGSPIISTLNLTDYGTVAVGTPITHSFTIRNDGNTTLTLGTITVPDGFKLMSAPPASISPKSSTSFSVQMLSQSIGYYDGFVSIPSNDGMGDGQVENPFMFRIAGIVQNADGEITILGNGQNITNGKTDPSLVIGTDFGSTLPSSYPMPTRTFTIRNDGLATLSVSNITVPTGFSIGGYPTSIGPKASVAFTVTFLNQTIGTYTGDVVIVSNDGDGGDGIELPFTFTITGTVIDSKYWFAYTPTADQTSIATSTVNGITTATVNLVFPNSGYLVTDWGTMTRQGNVFYVNLLTGQDSRVNTSNTTMLSNSYVLGTLDPGIYTFRIIANYTLIEEMPLLVMP